MKCELELKGTAAEKNAAIALLVNSGYKVGWETVKIGNTKRKVLVVDDMKAQKYGVEVDE